MLHGNVNAMLRQKVNKDLMFKELMVKEILLPVHSSMYHVANHIFKL